MNYENYLILKQTVDKAKKDLETSVTEEDLDELYASNNISKGDYEKAKQALESLKAIVKMFEPMVIEYENNNDINNQ